MANARDEVRRRDLAAFLRARREAMQPEQVNLPRRGRRRVKGLRRYEVADLAAVSVTWYTWLEQGRDIHTTPQVLDAIARALQFDAPSHHHLRRLAGAPVSELSSEQTLPDVGLKELIDEVAPSPAVLIDPSNALLAWNKAYARFFVDPLDLPANRRNGLIILLTTPQLQLTLHDWEREARSAIGALRAESAKHPGDARFAEVIELLTEESEMFRATWAEHGVEPFTAHDVGFDHPVAGTIHTRAILMRPLGTASLTLMMYRPVDPTSRARLEWLTDDETVGAAAQLISDKMRR